MGFGTNWSFGYQRTASFKFALPQLYALKQLSIYATTYESFGIANPLWDSRIVPQNGLAMLPGSRIGTGGKTAVG